MPLLIVAAALNVLFLPQGTRAVEAAAAAQPTSIEVPSPAMLLMPSPQPGVGEPELVPADLPQSY